MQSFNRAALAEPSRRASATWFCVVLSVVLTFSIFEMPVWAQVPPGGVKSKDKKKTPPRDPKHSDDLKIDSETLPNGFQPPPPPLPIMDLEKPIATKDELERTLKKEWQKFSKVRTDCDTTEAGRKVIQASVRYRLASLTAITPSVMRDKPNELIQIRLKLLNEIANIGAPGKRPAEIAATSKVVNDEVIKQIPELLKNNFYVRLNAVYILSEMDYAPAFQLLLQVFTAKDIREDENEGQPEACKLAALNGLIRIFRFTNISVKDRTTVALAIIEELQKKDTFWWIQLRMIEALRYCDITGVDAGNNNRPFVVEALLAIVKDPDRAWRVRAKACYALGRVPLPSSIKPEDVVTVIADFALQLSTAAAANPVNTNWKRCFADLWLAFEFNDEHKEKDLDTEKKNSGGLMARYKSTAQPAYDLIVPIFNSVRNEKAPGADDLRKLTEFVRTRPTVAKN